MKTHYLILFVFFSFGVFAQDTLYKRNSTDIIVAKVIEISTIEIKYKRFDLLDGPMFVIDKNQIEKIKFMVGSVEYFNVNVPKPIINNNQFVNSNSEAIEPYGNRGIYLYKEKKTGVKDVFDIIEYKNIKWKSREISTLIYESKKQKRNQYLIGFSSIGVGIFTLVGISAVSSNSYNYQNSVSNSLGVFALGALGVIATQVISYNCKLSHLKFANKAVDIYNKNILNQ
jgi:hypothetical protein